MRRICEKNLRQSERLFYQCFPNVIITQNISFHNLYLWDNKKIEYLAYAASKGTVASPHRLAALATSPAQRGKLIYRYPKPSPLSRGAVNVSQSHIAVARVLGTFSHTTCYPISFVLWTCFLDRSARGTAQAVEGAQNRGCCIFVQQPRCVFDAVYYPTAVARAISIISLNVV